MYSIWCLTLLARHVTVRRMSKKLVYRTTTDVANHFGVDGATVRRWVLNGVVKPDRTTPGGHHRFTDENIAAIEAESAPSGTQRSQATATA